MLYETAVTGGKKLAFVRQNGQFVCSAIFTR